MVVPTATLASKDFRSLGRKTPIAYFWQGPDAVVCRSGSLYTAALTLASRESGMNKGGAKTPAGAGLWNLALEYVSAPVQKSP